MAYDEIRFDPAVLSGNETLLLIAAREGMGLAFLPRVIVEDDLAAGTLEHLLPTAPTPSAPSTPSTPTAPTCPPRCGRSGFSGGGGVVRDSRQEATPARRENPPPKQQMYLI